MKARTFILVLVGIPLLGWGAVKLYLHSRIDSGLEKLARQAAPVATLRWGAIETSLSGEASVHDIRIDLRRPPDTLTIRQVTYDTPNIWFLLRDLGKVNNARIPESLHLRVKGLRLDLYGNLTDRFEQFINNVNLDLSGVNRLCGGRLFMGPRELRDMGYEAIVLDGDLGFDIDTITEELTWSLQLAARDMFALQVKNTFDGFLGTPLQALVPTPHPVRTGPLRIRLADRNYVKRMVTYCARHSDMGIGEYVQEEANQPDAYFVSLWGIAPGPGLREAYRQYLADPRSIQVSLEWPEEANLQTLARFKPEEIPALLALRVEVNDQPVTDLAFRFQPDRQNRLASGFRHLFADAPPPAPKSRPRPPHYVERYQPVEPARLGDYLEQPVRLHTDGGQRREGILIRLSGNNAYVKQAIHHGEFVMQVPLSSVRRAEVLQRIPADNAAAKHPGKTP